MSDQNTAPDKYGKYTNMYGCWSYDAYGNRTAEAMSGTPCSNNPPLQSWASYNQGNNQMLTTSYAPAGVQYDAAGNTLYDGRNRYWYDAEGRVCAVQPVGGGFTQYVYDAEGARIVKGTINSEPASYTSTCAAPAASGSTLTNSAGLALTKRYLVDLGGDQVTEFNENGSTETWVHSNVWVSSRLTATYDAAGLHYALADPLGTKREQINIAGVVENWWTSMPFGNDLNNPYTYSSPDATEHHFISRERDTETGNDDLLARYYSSALGRFITPDWSVKEDPVPYAKLDDPQSLNLYAYVRNNPLIRIDPDGHTCKQGDWGCNAWDMVNQTWNQIHAIAATTQQSVGNSVKKAKQVVAAHPRTMKALKGVGKVVGGIATVGLSATTEVGSGGLATVPVVFGVMGGITMFVSGVGDIFGAATDTDMSSTDEGLSSVSNPAALLTTVGTGGNVKAGARAGAIGGLSQFLYQRVS